MTEPGEDQTEALAGARRKRVALLEAIGRTEAALAAPRTGARWRPEVMQALDLLRVALDEHIVEVEASDGLLPELRRLDPRFANAAASLENEHPALCRQVEAARQTASSDQAPPEDVRRQVLDVLVALVRHRQRGADLVYDAYSIDIGSQ